MNRLRRIICYLSDGHVWKDEGEPTEMGGTTAPYPAVDELEQLQRCSYCGTTRRQWAGWVMSNDRPSIE